MNDEHNGEIKGLCVQAFSSITNLFHEVQHVNSQKRTKQLRGDDDR